MDRVGVEPTTSAQLSKMHTIAYLKEQVWKDNNCSNPTRSTFPIFLCSAASLCYPYPTFPQMPARL
jgi:hypothetical protein